MGIFNQKSKIVIMLLVGLTTSLFAYNNCSKKTFTVSNETVQRILSEGASIFINNDETYTNSSSVVLTIENNSANEMYVTNAKDCLNGGQWETYSTSKVWTLAESNVRTKAYVKFREVVDGPESICTWDSIIHDNVGPTLTIVAAAPAITNSTNLSFQFASADNLSGIKGYSCKNQSGQNLASCVEAMSLSNVQEGPGSVSIVAEDNAGNLSTPLVQTWLADFTAPRVFINSAPSSRSNQTSGSFTFSGTDNFSNALTFECRTDAGTFASCTSPYNFTLNEGTHVFEVRAKDAAGNLSVPASHNWIIDLSAPTVRILTGPTQFSNVTNAQFTFDGMDDGAAITRFECRMDAGAFTVNCNSPANYSSLSAGNHTFQIRGFDFSGNPSAPASYSWTIDNRAPQVVITSQPDRETRQTGAVLQFVATDADTAVQSTECRLDSGAFEACNNSITYGPLPQGNHTFQVRARDVAGNISPTVSYTWLVDLTPPSLSFVRTPSNPTVNPVAQFEMRATDNSPSPITLECRLNNEPQFSACTTQQTLTMTSDGVKDFSVRATDLAGNVSPIITHSWLLDTTGPAINFTTIPNAVVRILDDAVIAFEVVDLHSGVASNGVQCGMQSQLAGCPAVHSMTFTTLAEDSYTFTVNAVDNLGNTSTNSIHFSVTNNIRPVSQSVTVTSQNRADILIVIDNSGSMNPEQLNMATRFATFIDQLQGLDWRIAIVTTDMSADAYKKDGRFLLFDKTAFNSTNANGSTNVVPDFYFIHSGMTLAAAKSSFGKTIQRPASEGSGYEQGIAASLKAIQRSQSAANVVASAPNRSFFRNDAVLSVLVVTDANETNNAGTQTQNTPENWISSVRTIWPSKPMAFNSIVVKSGDSACLAVNGNEQYGVAYEQLSTLTGGIVGTVCASDYGSQLANMGQAVVSLSRIVNLSCAPVNQNKNATLIDDIMVTLQSGAMAAVESVSGQSVTLVNDLPVGTHQLNYFCLQ